MATTDCKIGHEPENNAGGQRRRPDVDDIVTDKDRGKETMGILLHLFDKPVCSISLLCNVPGPCPADGKQSGFR